MHLHPQRARRSGAITAASGTALRWPQKTPSNRPSRGERTARALHERATAARRQLVAPWQARQTRPRQSAATTTTSRHRSRLRAARPAEPDCSGRCRRRRRTHRVEQGEEAHLMRRPAAPPIAATSVRVRGTLRRCRRPRDSRSSPCSQRAIGVVKPVLARLTTRRGQGRAGAARQMRLQAVGACRGTAPGGSAAILRSRTLSTSGTRTSSECAMLAQSVSRRSWLRM